MSPVRLLAPVLVLLSIVLAGCAGELTPEQYTSALAERWQAVEEGRDPETVFADLSLDPADFDAYQQQVFSNPELAEDVWRILRRDYPELARRTEERLASGD